MNPYLITLWTLASILLVIGGILAVGNNTSSGDLAAATFGGIMLNAAFLTVVAALVASAVTWVKKTPARADEV